MNERVKKIKEHLDTYREIYIAAGVSIVVAGITCLIVRGRYAELRGGSENSTEFNVRPIIERETSTQPSLSILSGNSTYGDNSPISNVVNVLEREGRGHPGYIIRCLETQEEFPSQKATAKSSGIPESVLSGHLNGKFPDVDGLHYERIGVAS